MLNNVAARLVPPNHSDARPAPIDLATLRRIATYFDTARIVHIARMFVTSFAETLDEMRRAWIDGDLAAVGVAAHRGKGAALVIGARPLAARLAAIDDGIRGNAPHCDVDEKLIDVEGEFIRLTMWLDDLKS